MSPTLTAVRYEDKRQSLDTRQMPYDTTYGHSTLSRKVYYIYKHSRLRRLGRFLLSFD